MFVCVSFDRAESLSVKTQLDNLSSSLVQLQSSMDRVQANVTAVKTQINQTLSKQNCTGCDSLSEDLQKLTIDANISVSKDFAYESFLFLLFFPSWLIELVPRMSSW